MMYRRLPALNPATFCRILGGGGGFLSSVRLLSEFCPRRPPPPQAATAPTTVDEEKFGSLLSSPLMIVPPFSKTEEEYDDDYNDYFHFFRVVDQKKYRVRKNLGLAWQREYLTPDNATCIGSTHGWLVFLDPRNGFLYLLNPFIKHQNFSSLHNHNHLPYIPLPSLETLPTVKGMRVLKSDNFSPSTSLVRDFLMTFFDQTNEHKSPPSKTVALHSIQDVVLSSSPSSSLDNDQCTTTTTTTAVMNYGGYLYFCKLGVDERWNLLSKGNCHYCCDLIYFSKDGRFYSSGNQYEYHQLEAWDLTDHSCPKHQLIDPTFSSPRTIPDIPRTWHDSFVKYLVESSGDLLLVVRHFNTEFVPGGKEKDPIDPPKFHRTLRFVVHKLNFKLNKWEHVECLDDRSLFVGYNHSFSLSTRDYPELRGNSIYFTENYEELALMCNTGHDNGVFHLEDNSITYYRTRDWKCTEPHSHLVPSPVWICDAQNNVR